MALGLCLATKYTALLTLPLFVLLLDACWRAGWRWRQFAIAGGLSLLIAGPWFLRNAWLTGNPLDPLEIRVGARVILHGLFQARRSVDLRTGGGVWMVLAGRYHSMPVPILAVLALGWLAAIAGAWRRIWREPLVRICLLGPPIGILLFVFASPYPEVRFVFPALVLLFGASAIAIVSWSQSPATQLVAAVIVAGVSIATAFEIHWIVAASSTIALLGTGAVAGLFLLQSRLLHFGRQTLIGIAIATLLVAGSLAYVQWNAYVTDLVQMPAAASDPGDDLIVAWWRKYYPAESPAWEYVRRHIPAGVPIAYANTALIYPLMVPNRRVVYIPVRDGVHWPHDLAHFPAPVTGEQIISVVTQLTNAGANRAGWLRRIVESGVEYLVIAKDDAGPRPPELEFVATTDQFKLVFDDARYAIYSIRTQGRRP